MYKFFVFSLKSFEVLIVSIQMWVTEDLLTLDGHLTSLGCRERQLEVERGIVEAQRLVEISLEKKAKETVTKV